MITLLQRILNAASQLPPFPKVALRVLEMISDPINVDGRELVKVVGMDANLTANVLKAANSAYFALPDRVDNLAQALRILGLTNFQEIVMAMASAPILGREQSGYQLPRGELWRHSLATALMTNIISERVKHKPGPALYTAALLHDIGKVALGAFVQEKAALVLKAVSAGKSFLEAERLVLQMDHAEIGEHIVKHWNFSHEMADLIACHHDPRRKPESVEAAILYLSNLLCQLYGAGGGLDGLAYAGHQAVMSLLHLKEKDLESAMADLHLGLSKAEDMIGLASR